jgi:hypothetical protein
MEKSAMPFEYGFNDFDDSEKEELKEWKKESGYLVCRYFGPSLFTVMRKSVFEDAETWEACEIPQEKFWRVRFTGDRAGFYLRILSAELTYIFPMWLANALRNE